MSILEKEFEISLRKKQKRKEHNEKFKLKKKEENKVAGKDATHRLEKKFGKNKLIIGKMYRRMIDGKE